MHSLRDLGIQGHHQVGQPEPHEISGEPFTYQLGHGCPPGPSQRASQTARGRYRALSAWLPVQVGEIVKHTADKEVIMHKADELFDLTLGLRPIGPACVREEAIMGGKGQEGFLIGYLMTLPLLDHGLHVVVEDLPRNPPKALKGPDMARQQRGKVLLGGILDLAQARIAKDHRKAVYDRGGAIGPDYAFLSPIRLGLHPWHSFDTDGGLLALLPPAPGPGRSGRGPTSNLAAPVGSRADRLSSALA